MRSNFSIILSFVIFGSLVLVQTEAASLAEPAKRIQKARSNDADVTTAKGTDDGELLSAVSAVMRFYYPTAGYACYSCYPSYPSYQLYPSYGYHHHDYHHHDYHHDFHH